MDDKTEISSEPGVSTRQDSTPPQITMAEFFEQTPPGKTVPISKVSFPHPTSHGGIFVPHLYCPEIQLHCLSRDCQGPRFFSFRGLPTRIPPKGGLSVFLTYQCRNCNRLSKTFAVFVSGGYDAEHGSGMKYGEFPAFGPPTPARLLTLLGKDRDTFLKGRRCENQGLGVGAFAYYRRVVENQRNELIGEILRVAERTKASEAAIAALKAAMAENQFSKAVASIKDSIPATLLIDGHNPLTMLHTALSEGLHGRTDEECLDLATDVRVVLQELTEKAAVALKDHAEIKTAIARLQNRVQAKRGGDTLAADERTEPDTASRNAVPGTTAEETGLALDQGTEQPPSD